MNSILTVIIVVFKTKRIILKNFLSKINNKYQIIIIDNSGVYDFDEFMHQKNIKIIKSKKNNGNGAGINLGLKETITPYAIYFDIDTNFENNFLDEFVKIISEFKDFAILIPNINSSIISNDKLIEKYDAEGAAMLFDVKKIKKIGMFDENFFLYWEETDLYLKCKKNNQKIFILPALKIFHDGSSSIEGDKIDYNIIALRNWHYMWSFFYFYKKNYSYIYAVKKTYFIFIKDLLKLIYYLFKLDSKNIVIRFNRVFGVICAAFFLNSFKRL